MKKSLDCKTADLGNKEDFNKLQVGDIVKYITSYKEEGERTGIVTSNDGKNLWIICRDKDFYGRNGILEHRFELKDDKVKDYGRANNAFVLENSDWRLGRIKYNQLNNLLKRYNL